VDKLGTSTNALAEAKKLIESITGDKLKRVTSQIALDLQKTNDQTELLAASFEGPLVAAAIKAAQQIRQIKVELPLKGASPEQVKRAVAEVEKQLELDQNRIRFGIQMEILGSEQALDLEIARLRGPIAELILRAQQEIAKKKLTLPQAGWSPICLLPPLMNRRSCLPPSRLPGERANACASFSRATGTKSNSMKHMPMTSAWMIIITSFPKASGWHMK